MDLCCTPRCASARITHRKDIEGVHEPNHRLVKLHATELQRSYGRAHTAATNAFEHVEEMRRKIAELTYEETGPDELKFSSIGPTSIEIPTKSDKSDNIPNHLDGTKGGSKVDGKTTRDGRRDQVEDKSLPTCGKCEGWSQK